MGAEFCKEDVFSNTYTACVLIHIPSEKHTFLVLTGKLCIPHFEKRLGIVHDCYIVELYVETGCMKGVAVYHHHYVPESYAVGQEQAVMTRSAVSSAYALNKLCFVDVYDHVECGGILVRSRKLICRSELFGRKP